MRKMIFVVTVLCLMAFGLVGCNNGQNGAASGLSAADQEALIMAKQLYFSKKVLRCGEFTYDAVPGCNVSHYSDHKFLQSFDPLTMS
ncbi:MAG: hypothetical protein M0Z67_09040 [Nitrospiraceae bacterium]|nr:hypothetical protein [Nitrospiraceae bacterium]